MLTKQDMIRYTCTGCGKSFERFAGVEETSCPFCKPASEFEFHIPDLQVAMEEVVRDTVKSITDFAESCLDGARDRIRDEIRYAMKKRKEK